jgi:hypothetical protein
MIKLKRVETKSDWSDFIDLPWDIYLQDPYWVSPLKIAVRDMLDVNKNPFFKHASMLPLVAYRGGKRVGRAVGVIDDSHNRFHQEQTAFFGFFECINDPEISDHLFNEVARWSKERGMTTLRGPVNLSTNYECGLLVEGYKDPPTVMMTYNPPYYAELFEKWGFAKSKDLYAYNIDTKVKFSDRLLAHAEKLKQRGHVTFRCVNMKKFEEEVDLILDIYNDAWEKNWGFVPMEPEEFRHMAKDLKQVLDPRLLLIAEVHGEPAGFALTLPDINQALKKIKDGKLFPTGLLKLLWHAKGPGRRKTITRLRILTLGIKKAYRETGIGPLLYTEYHKLGTTLGYRGGEASWILEDNIPMNKALKMMCGERYKTYRLYDKVISG